jgi:hypothetical protein
MSGLGIPKIDLPGIISFKDSWIPAMDNDGIKRVVAIALPYLKLSKKTCAAAEYGSAGYAVLNGCRNFVGAFTYNVNDSFVDLMKKQKPEANIAPRSKKERTLEALRATRDIALVVGILALATINDKAALLTEIGLALFEHAKDQTRTIKEMIALNNLTKALDKADTAEINKVLGRFNPKSPFTKTCHEIVKLYVDKPEQALNLLQKEHKKLTNKALETSAKIVKDGLFFAAIAFGGTELMVVSLSARVLMTTYKGIKDYVEHDGKLRAEAVFHILLAGIYAYNMRPQVNTLLDKYKIKPLGHFDFNPQPFLNVLRNYRIWNPDPEPVAA